MKDGFLRHRLRPAAVAFILAAAPAAAAAQTAAQTAPFAEATAQHLAELQISDSEIESIEYKLRRNMTDKAGPAILGARAWIRLEGCSGWLVIDMNRSAFVRQAYTRGDCRVEGVPAY